MTNTAGDLGIHTFPEDNNYKIGGGAAWGWYSYDPELNTSTTRPVTPACGALAIAAARSL